VAEPKIPRIGAAAVADVTGDTSRHSASAEFGGREARTAIEIAAKTVKIFFRVKIVVLPL
jgi:hypothetical protein